jgi:hypothetical protein
MSGRGSGRSVRPLLRSSLRARTRLLIRPFPGLFLGLSLLFGCGLLTRGGGHGQRPGPRIELEKSAWSFGTIARGDTARTEITVANRGSDSLGLELNTACTCLSARAEPAVVPPQRSGKIVLAFTGESVSEAVSKTLFIDSNDPADPRVTLTVTGKVVEGEGPHLVVEPDPLWIEGAPPTDGAGQPGEARPGGADLTIANSGARDLVISDVRCLGCSIDWSRFTLSPGESAQLRIGVTPGWKGSRWVEIESNDPVTPLKKVGVVGPD